MSQLTVKKVEALIKTSGIKQSAMVMVVVCIWLFPILAILAGCYVSHLTKNAAK